MFFDVLEQYLSMSAITGNGFAPSC